MVVLVSWFIATFTTYLYIRFGTGDLEVIQDKFKVGIYKAAIALMIMRSTLFVLKDLLW